MEILFAICILGVVGYGLGFVVGLICKVLNPDNWEKANKKILKKQRG